MAITVTSAVRLSGALFGGTSQHIHTGLTIPAGSLVVLAESNGNSRNLASATIGSTGTTTAFTSLVSISASMAMAYAIATGSETNTDIVTNLSGNAGDTEMVAILVIAGAEADQSGATSLSESSASATSHDIGAITPPTANNIIVFATSRGNRDWTDDADYTLVNDIVNTHAFGYRIQTAQDADTYNFSTEDAAAAADMLLAAFAGTADGGGIVIPKFMYNYRRRRA